VVRPSEDGSFAKDAYSDNVIDICPVGALLSKDFLHKARVWYLRATPSVCPGCERGCAVNLWHRREEWMLKSPRQAARNEGIDRVTPLENPAVNGPWVCNKARDIPRLLGRARAAGALFKGAPAPKEAALLEARRLIAEAKRPVAVVSSWASNEELAAFKAAFGTRLRLVAKQDHEPQPGEVVQDDLLIRADKNPNAAGVRALLGECAAQVPQDADLVLVWGEGFDFRAVPAGARIVFLNAFLAPENGHADVFLPVSIQTERDGSYTNFAGVTSRFRRCFAPPAGAWHAQDLFPALAGTGRDA
jgi:NADH-quinone oxidoreductase subunit G